MGRSNSIGGSRGLVWLSSVPSLKNGRSNFSGSLFQIRSKLHVGYCAGFQTPAVNDSAKGAVAGV